jgi:beta-lactamase superfamily II metal-dependent hydrolase
VRTTLEALNANDGDCLLLHHGSTLILIDGGSAGVYRDTLKPRLEQLRGGGRLALRLAMVSHIDADHITGIQDLLEDLVENDAPYRIAALWHNSFERLCEAPKFAASVRQGNAVRNAAVQLAIPIEKVCAPGRVEIAPGLTFTILGPRAAELKKLDQSWKLPAAQTADYLNRTVPNLSSIVVLVEAGKKRLLLTGDSGGDLILRSLEEAKLLPLHLDVLKLPHHGSNHSIDRKFFETVTADHYVISGNGKHGNPHPDTLAWLAEARHGSEADVYFTNAPGALPVGSGLRWHARKAGALSISVTLDSAADKRR